MIEPTPMFEKIVKFSTSRQKIMSQIEIDYDYNCELIEDLKLVFFFSLCLYWLLIIIVAIWNLKQIVFCFENDAGEPNAE